MNSETKKQNSREALLLEVKSLIHSHPNLALQMGTGVGKSRFAIEALNEVLTEESEVLILVAERAHIFTWENEISKWHLKADQYSIFCYASMHKTLNKHWDAIIFDEAHHLGSELRTEYLSHIDSDYKIFLSATLGRSISYKIRSAIGDFYSMVFSLQDAIDSSILPEPKIILIPLTLDDTNRTETILEERGKEIKRMKLSCNYEERNRYLPKKHIYPNLSLTIHCTPRQKYDYLSELMEENKRVFMNTGLIYAKNKWQNYGSKRKAFLAESKTSVARQILSDIHKRYICFCGSINQCNELGGTNAIHSKARNTQKILDAFNNGDIDNIFCVGMLKEGVNLSNIEAGIIIQLDGNQLSFIQKHGRAMRADSPVQYIIYYKDTRDEEYLLNALEGIDEKYIEFLNLTI